MVMTDKQTAKDEGGFSLLEVLVALVILGVGLLGISMLQITAIEGNAQSMRISEANALIAAKIEECRQLPYDQVTDKTENGVHVQNDSSLYTRKVEVDAEDDRKYVTVTVSWKDKTDHSVSFQTIIANPDNL